MDGGHRERVYVFVHVECGHCKTTHDNKGQG